MYLSWLRCIKLHVSLLSWISLVSECRHCLNKALAEWCKTSLTDSGHTGAHTYINTPAPPLPMPEEDSKATYKSSFGSRLLHQVRWTSQQDALLPSQDNQMGRRGEADSTTIVHRKLRRSHHHLPTMHPHAVSHSTHMLLHTKDAPQLLTRTYSRADQLARLHTRSNAKRSQEPRHPRNVRMYGATLHQCLAPAWRLLRLTVERERAREERK